MDRIACRGVRIRITVAIAVYDQAHFLAAALASVQAQTRPADQIVVVDDGSHDDPASVAAAFTGVEFVRQANGGLSAARNTGLALARHEAVLFLDADDLLAPGALAASEACLAANPGAALVFGAHRRVDAAGERAGPLSFHPTGPDAHADLLRGNFIAMHGTVLYDRQILRDAGGFDTALRKCEDYDVYLRLSRDYRIAHHGEWTADYRIHGANMSGDSRSMLGWVERVRRRYRPGPGAPAAHRAAWADGARIWQRYYVEDILDRTGYRGSRLQRGRAYVEALRTAPGAAGAVVTGRLGRALGRRLPAPWRHRAKRLMGRTSRPPPGHVRMGDLAGTSPISFDFGFDRGTPVDRYYIEAFLARHAGDIRGRVLEIGDAAYSRRFGTGIDHQDVLHVDRQAEGATIVGDLSQAGVLPQNAFDCMIITQTLHLIYDMPAAIARIHGSLKPGGVLLLTVPGISPIDRGEWGDTWYWSLTGQSLRRLLADGFGAGQADVAVHGNVYAATCFLQGLALEEVKRGQLDKVDASYPVVVTGRAVRKG